VGATRATYDKSKWLMMRMLRSDWQTKVTAHAHHQPLEHQGSSHYDDAIFGPSAELLWATNPLPGTSEDPSPSGD
jgi:hypothetical protein